MSLVLRQYKFEATLWDGVNDPIVAGEFFDLGGLVHDDLLAPDAARAAVVANFTGTGLPYDGWTVQAIRFWPVVTLIP